ncbi:response regulator [Ramlibacter sp. G-1-2-2]|uniref:Response regulator n=1 Tax=Ramlibacter agri TaxID=2728837 RepID=A0A848H548_9BURK|nr:response regulator [Ramlibacter agri]NML45617.1 response regulator [Ramlibacter agri]
MAQRIYIKVVGFSEEERHALNTLFRLSEQCLTMYQLWSPQARAPAGMALLDGDSYEARLEAESPLNSGMKLLWIGADAPPSVWRSIARPFQWPEVIEALDTVFNPGSVDLDLDVTPSEAPDSLPPLPPKLALIVSPSRDERLYLRARLSLAHLTQADEAESGAEALQLARGKQYDFALVDFRVPDMDAWNLLRQLKQGKRPIQHVALTKAQRSLPEHVRAWWGGAEALLDSPPHPQRLNAWLRRL